MRAGALASKDTALLHPVGKLAILPHVTILHEQKLAYVETPKVASTTLYAALLLTAGVPLEMSDPRKPMRTRWGRSKMRELGIRRGPVAAQELEELRARHDDYIWFAARREPLARLISGYRNKLHRYARRFDRRAYWRGQLDRFLEGRRAWGDSRYTALHVGQRIGFKDFVTALERYGLTFDKHFDLQSSQICMDSIRYHRLLRQEDLEADLRAMCAEIGHAYPFPEGLPRLNPSSLPGAADITPSPDLVTRIRNLYAEDYDKLGYR